MLELLLPVPPSVNGIYPGKSKRHKSKAYKQWLAEADWQLKQQHSYHIPGRISAQYILHFPNNRARDIENYCKVTSDYLARRGIIEDDERIDRLLVERGEKGNSVYIALESM